MANSVMDTGTGFEGPVHNPGDRRLPIYLLLDTSYRMHGDGIEALQNAFQGFLDEIRYDDQLHSVTYVSMISFNTIAKSLTDGLVRISDLNIPLLQADENINGVARLDLAFQLLGDSFDTNLKKPVKNASQGDYKPLVYILTAGEPTDANGDLSDNWIEYRNALVNRPKGKFKPASITVIGCGMDASVDKIKEIVSGTGIQGCAFNFGDSQIKWNWKPIDYVDEICEGDTPGHLDDIIP